MYLLRCKDLQRKARVAKHVLFNFGPDTCSEADRI